MGIRGVIAAVVFWASPLLAQAPAPITIAVGEWPPYTSSDMSDGGRLCAVVKAAFELERVPVEVQFYPWERALKYVETGKCTASSGWLKTPERMKKFIYSDLLYDEDCVLFHLKTFAFAWSSVEDLRNLRIGGSIGYNYGELLEKAVKDGVIKIERAPNDLMNFQKLLSGRVQVCPQSLEVGEWLLDHHFTPEEVAKVTHHPKPYAHAQYFLVMSKAKPGNTALMAQFNRGLKRLKRSGQFERIFQGR